MRLSLADTAQQPPRRPQCECFSLCGRDAAAAFHARLPRNVSHGSPWEGYLRTVYSGPVPLPFDVSTLEFFWVHLLPTAMHLCPKPHLTPPAPVLPVCPPDRCAGWLEEPQSRARAHVADKRSFVWSPTWPPLPDDPELNLSPKMRRKLPHNQFLLIQPYERSDVPNDGAWVEVTRITPPNVLPGVTPECDAHYGWQRGCQEWRAGSKWPYQPAGYMQRPECQPLGCCREGRNYGCWFWPAKGSGIFVNVGRTQIARHRAHAEELGYGARTQVFNQQYGRNVTVRLRGNDCMYARVAHERQLDSVQIMRANRLVFAGQNTEPVAELVIAAADCVHPTRLLTQACPPLELRTGVDAQKTCACYGARTHTLLNCGKRRGRGT